MIIRLAIAGPSSLLRVGLRLLRVFHVALLLVACCSSGASAAPEKLNPRSSRGQGTSSGQTQRHRRTKHEAPICYEGHVEPDNPSSLGYYRALYDYLASANFEFSQRVGSVEAIRAGSLPPDAPIAGPKVDLALMRISSILAFSDSELDPDGGRDGDGVGTVLVPRGNGGVQMYGDAAGFLLAVHHFNNGDGSVVRQVSGINETCPVRFVVDFADSESSQTVAVDRFSSDVCSNPDRPPSALFSAWRSAVSVPLAILSGVYKIPQISPLSTSPELDDITQYTHFSRLIPSDAGTAQSVIAYLRSRSPNVRHLGVLYVNDVLGSAYYQALAESAQSLPETQRIEVKGSPFSYNNAILNPDDIKLAVRALANTELRVFFGVVFDVHYELVMETAFEFGILGPGYVWIMADALSESYLQGRAYPAGSPLAIASQGIGIIKAEGGRETANMGEGDGSSTGFDRFSRAWYGQSGRNVDYYNCVGHPPTNTADDPSIYHRAKTDIFAREGGIAPSAGSVFLYDSVMSLGLAACSLLDGGTEVIDSTDLFEAFLEQTFEGASGRVVVDPATHSRDPSSAFFVVYNAKGETKDGLTTFSVDTTSHTVIDAGAGGGLSMSWVDMNGTSFVYSDGTTTFPPLEEDLNMIPAGLKIAGYALFGVAALVIVGCAVWLCKFRNRRQVKHRQPILLGLVLLGCLTSTSTILALAQESPGDGPVPGCMVVPWTYSVGFCLTFATLLAKIWRIKKLFAGAARMRRTAVTVKDALVIVGGIILVDVVILGVWTGVDPLKWTREVLPSDTFGKTASQGYCTSDHFIIFVSIIATLHFAILAVGAYFCYVSRRIPTQFSEGKFVSLAILCNLQIYLVGLPVLVLAGADAGSSFFIRTAIIWINNVSVVGFVFGNLIYAVHEDFMSTRTAIKFYIDKSDRKSCVSSVPSRRQSYDPETMHDKTTDLITAASKGDLDMVRCMLEEKADISEGSKVVVQSLTDINAGDYDYRTAIHLAASEGHVQVVEELCIRGADVNAEDRWGSRPLDDANRCNHLDCASILTRHGAKPGQQHLPESVNQASIGNDDCSETLAPNEHSDSAVSWAK